MSIDVDVPVFRYNGEADGSRMVSGGISEVLVMGGDVQQYQVQVRVDDLRRYDITIKEVEQALERSNRNVTGGFLTEQGANQILVRSLGRIESSKELEGGHAH